MASTSDSSHTDAQPAYFGVSEPYEKEYFIQLSNSILNTALLLFAPCGVPRRLQGLLTGTEFMTEHGSMFQHCVDVISRKVYAISNVKESRIAATLNEYVEKEHDAEVIKAAKGATEALETVFEPRSVIELPLDADVKIAASMFRSVLNMWQRLREGLAATQQVDNEVLAAYRIEIPLNLPAYQDIARCITADVVADLHTTFQRMTLTHEQFVALVEIYESSPEIQEVLREGGFKNLQDAKQQTLLARHPNVTFRDLLLRVVEDHYAGAEGKQSDVNLASAQAALNAVDEAVSSAHKAIEALRMGDLHTAAEYFERGLPAEGVVLPSLLRAEMRANHAACMMELENIEECLEDCNEAVRLNPNSFEAFRLRGKAEMMQGQLEEAANDVMRAFLLAGQTDPAEAHLVEEIARDAVRASAKDMYHMRTDAVHSFPQDWMVESYFTSYKDLVRGLGIPATQANGTTTPLKISHTFCTEDDEEGMRLARALANVVYQITNKQYTEAHASVQALRATYVSSEGKNYDEQTTERLLASGISHKILARLLNLLGSFHYLAGETAEALWAFRESCSLDTELVDSIVKLAAVHGDLDEQEQALMYLEQAEMLERTRSDIYLHRAQILIMAGEVTGAISELRRSRDLDETNPMVWATLGLAYYKASPTTPQIARGLLQEASEKFPDNMEIWLYYGEILAQVGDVTGAMNAFRTAASLDARCPLPFVNAARAYVAMNQHDVAMLHLQKAVQIDPTVSSSHVDMGQALLHAGNTEGAMQEFEVAIQKARYVPEYRDALSCKMVAQIQLQVEQELGIKRTEQH